MPDQTVFRWTSPITGTESLQEFREPIPRPGPDDVVVAVRGVGVNYRDVAIANRTYPLPIKQDLVPMADMAGRVVEVGARAAAAGLFAVGDAVIAISNTKLLYGSMTAEAANSTLGGPIDGVLQEYVALPAHMLIKLPAPAPVQGSPQASSLVQWASFPGTGSTAWNTLYGNIPLKPGMTVVLQGTGGVSIMTLIMARAAGATTIITSSSDEKLAYVKSTFGADHTINYKTHPEWGAEVQRLTGGRGADQVVDVGGLGTMRQSLAAVAYSGIISLVGFLADEDEKKEPIDWLIPTLSRGVILRGIMMGSKQQTEEAVRFVVSRGLQLPVDRTFGFTRDEVIQALRYVEEGKQIGKVVITVGSD
ncbi:hypothetical protein SLS62_009082 [Diatrype stigma]|uniref:Enoyl reductase (ER) domain-containing protein n=1 Tax=Diatrype stigma TaxID=117547 RepID=A0AAN9UHJ6_9PEZI